MKVDYDPARDLLYVAFQAAVKAAKTVTVCPGVHADFDSNEKLIGIEVIDASEILNGRLQFEVELRHETTESPASATS